MLDEPGAGLDAFSKERVEGILRSLAEEGKTVVVVEHDPSFVANIADQVYVLAKGKLVFEGQWEDATGDGLVRRTFLSGV